MEVRVHGSYGAHVVLHHFLKLSEQIPSTCGNSFPFFYVTVYAWQNEVRFSGVLLWLRMLQILSQLCLDDQSPMEPTLCVYNFGYGPPFTSILSSMRRGHMIGED